MLLHAMNIFKMVKWGNLLWFKYETVIFQYNIINEIPAVMLSIKVVGMQKIPTSKSPTARFKMKRLVTVLICLLLRTMKHTTPLPSMHKIKMSKYEIINTAATEGR